jgi:hypothetical protein
MIQSKGVKENPMISNVFLVKIMIHHGNPDVAQALSHGIIEGFEHCETMASGGLKLEITN